jgi:hypothetical protein
MLTSIRQSTQQLRLWLIAAVAILALTSILEAGHVHGVFTQTDDQCALCQHSVALDKALTTSAEIIIPLLLAVFTFNFIQVFIPQQQRHIARIRAPPAQLHTR